MWRSTSASVVAGDISAMLWNGVSRTPRFRAYKCRWTAPELKVLGRVRLGAVPRPVGPEEVLGAAAQPSHVPGQARLGDARLDAVRPAPASGIMRAKAASVSTSPSVARIAASERVRGERAADAADVDVLELDRPREPRRNVLGEAVGRRGSPPAIGLPIVTTSGYNPCAAVYPPGPQQIVCVSSIASSEP